MKKKIIIFICNMLCLSIFFVACSRENTRKYFRESELQKKLKEQPVYVERTEYINQGNQYKVLYPDILSAVVKNNSGKDVKNVVVAFAAWDVNNFPVKIIPRIGINNEDYIVTCDYGNVNMVDGSTFGDDFGLEISPDTPEIEKIQSIVVSYKDFDGTEWKNPYYEQWTSIYENKKLESDDKSENSTKKGERINEKDDQREEVQEQETEELEKIHIGQTITEEGFAEITLKNVSYESKITPKDTSSCYTYYEPKNSDTIYLACNFDFSNLKTKEGNQLEDYITFQVTYEGGYHYTGYAMAEQDNFLNQYPNLIPLSKYNSWYLMEVPISLQNTPYELKCTINGKTYLYE